MQHNKDPRPSYASLLKEYARLAARYDKRWAFYVRATTQESLKRLRIHPAGRVLDVGCGTGAFLQELLISCPTLRVAGVDPCAEMLAIARKRLGSEVEIRPGWAEQLPFEDNSFDAVTSSSVFHYIRQPEQALREMDRVLVPGGQLLVTDWCADYFACRACDWFLRIFNRAHIRAYREREICDLVRASPFTAIQSDHYKINWLWGLMTVTGRASGETIQGNERLI